MTPPQAQPVSTARPLAGTAIVAAAAGAEGPFVINLRSSTTPMALSQPNDPALARFKFFMSRRLEDGRERFRLHMGFFETLAEAEEWLAVVREIYPGAWAGEAPGKRLKARAAEPAAPATPAAAASVGAPAAAQARTAPAPRAVDSQPVRRQTAAANVDQPRAPAQAAVPHASPAIPRNVPVLRAAPAEAPPSPIVRSESRATAAGTPRRPAADAIPRAPAAREARPPAAQPRPPVRGGSPPPGARTVASPKQKAGAVRLPLSNVREVLAALDETGATRQLPALPVATPAPKAEPPAQPRTQSSLSDTQVLKLLEARRADGSPAEVDSGISVLKPDDSGTRRVLREAVETDAPVSFAVQLQFSVQSIDITKVPPLAIFSAYTLYTVEGSREGRRWYGLRLGFFSDALSAKQVAHYVRSEFNSVAVVPVGPQERGRASEGNKSATQGPKPAKSPLRDRLPEPTSEFKLIDDTAARSVPVRAARPAAAETSTAAAPAERSAAEQPPTNAKSSIPPAKRGPRTPAGRVRARDKRSAHTLEETLEILGADQLEIDRGSGETLNDTGVRHLTVQVRKETAFTRLLDRLAERARGR